MNGEDLGQQMGSLDVPAETGRSPDPGWMDAARALQVVRRTVRYALKDERSTLAVRCLDGTCRPWVERAARSDLDEPGLGAVNLIRRRLEAWSENLSLGARRDLLSEVETHLRVFEPVPESTAVFVERISLSPSLDLQPRGRRPGRPTEAPALPVVATPVREKPASASTDEAGLSAMADLPLASKVFPESGVPESLSPQAEPACSPTPVLVPQPAAPETGDAEWEALRAAVKAPDLDADDPIHEEECSRAICRIGDQDGTGISLEEWGGVSPLLTEALAAVGIKTVADLLQQAPVRLEILPRAVAPSEPFADGTRQVVRATVRRRLTRLSTLGRRFEVILTDGQVETICRWVIPVNEAFRRCFVPGARVAVCGLVERDGETILLHDGDLVWVDSRGQGRQSCYDLPGMPDADMRMLLRRALDEFVPHLLDPLPDSVKRNMRLPDLGEAYERLHFPAQGHRRGRERLAFDELFLYQIGVGLRRKRGPTDKGLTHVLTHKQVAQLQLISPNLMLNDDQELAFSEIRRDLVGQLPMNRLLQGDVGAGKGLVSLLTAVLIAGTREQVVIVAPDALAAEHRYLFAEPLLRSVGLVSALIPEKPSAAQVDALRRGEIHLIYATPRFTKPWPTFRRLGLVIVEERGEYGTISFNDLPGKGARPDLLVLTAAPIPTSLALTVFGTQDMSLIASPGAGNVSAAVYPVEQRNLAYQEALAEVDAGRQAYVVFPLIRGHEPLELRDLARVADALRNDAFPGKRIGIFSGLMSREERQRTYDDMRHRRIDVLLTTTIIEDGPVIPTVTAVVVEGADRFDLIRLHRLRAHVSRGNRAGRCLLVMGERPDPEGVRNAEFICREKDGFRVAELDLVQRGAGALLGRRANEMPSFRFVDGMEHRELLVRARAEAFALLTADPGLTGNDSSALRDALEEVWKRWFTGQFPLVRRAAASTAQRSGRRRRRRKA